VLGLAWTMSSYYVCPTGAAA